MLIMDQPDEPVNDLGIFVTELHLVPVAGLADAQCLACQSYTDVVSLNRACRHLAAVRWL